MAGIKFLSDIKQSDSTLTHSPNAADTWQLDTGNRFSVAAEDTSPDSLFFKPDGTKMYLVGDTGNDISEYALSTAWDLTTCTYTDRLNLATGSASESNPHGMFISPDGLQLFVVFY